MKTQLISKDDWQLPRQYQSEKFSNYKFIRKFNKAVHELRNEFDDSVKIQYLSSDEVDSNTIEYTEASPVPHFIKVVKDRYFITKFDPIDAWENHDINTQTYNYVNKLSFSKYKDYNSVFEFDGDYILYALQSTRSDLDLIIKTMKYANDTSTNVLFKLHPFMDKDHVLLKAWPLLEEKGLITKHTVLVPASHNTAALIDNSTAVWTHSSGVGFTAVMKGKPVTTFGQVDYSPLCGDQPATEETKQRFISWFYDKIVVDVSNTNYKKILKDRIVALTNDTL